MTKLTKSSDINRAFCVAPMLDCTDRHARYLMRLISQHAVMYTEMVTTGALIFGDKPRFLDFNKEEHPISLQLGGSDPAAMAQCAELAQEWNYDEVNINVGCPSDRVQSGAFGACLMSTPELVAENVKAMSAVTDIPVTVKTRIGIDDQEPRDSLWEITDLIADAGCKTVLVHARKAWLKGLSPKENRDVPPLDYELVYQLKEAFPELEIIINGGIKTIEECQTHMQQVDGVMVGREAYSNPYMMAEVDAALYTDDTARPSRAEVLSQYIQYCQTQLDKGVRLNHLTRHVIGLFHGEPSSRAWRQHISQNAHLPSAGVEVLEDAFAKQQEGASGWQEQAS